MRWWYLLFVIVLFAQHDSIPAPNFIAPVKGSIQTTGTFGELRSNHFHAGLDIRGGVGRSLYAIADGFISRIRVTTSGYGQAIYIQHPSGHTSVYGHMDRFRDDMADYVRALQYENENFLIDIEPSPDQFPVQQGELVGYIGQRGYVSGPHLHFEIRETASGRTLNPLNFGIEVKDNRAPQIRGLRLFELDQDGNTLHAYNQSITPNGHNAYRTRKDTIYVDEAYIGLGIKTYDQQDARPNLNGVYEITLTQKDSLVFGFKMDHFDLEQTRYLNAHLDYEEKTKHNSWYHQCFRLPGNQLDFYEHNDKNGRIALAPGEHKSLQFDVWDRAKNHARLNLVVKRRKTTSSSSIPYTYYLPHDEESIIDNDAFRAHFPTDAFYEDLYLDYDQVKEESEGLHSDVHRIQRHTTPVHRFYDLHIRPHKIADSLRSKAIITHCKDGGKAVSWGGEWTDEGRLRSPVRTFGNFAIMLDTLAPSIRPLDFSANMQGWKSFSFRLDDNFPTTGKARDFRFRGEVDGEWILLEYDARTQRLFHKFDGHISKGKHELVIRVKDDRDNETTLKRNFRF